MKCEIYKLETTRHQEVEYLDIFASLLRTDKPYRLSEGLALVRIPVEISRTGEFHIGDIIEYIASPV